MPGRRQPAAALAENLQARTAQRGVRLLRGQLSAFAYGFPLPKWSTVQRFVLESLVDDEFITVEIDDNGCGRLKFELPLDVTEAEMSTSRAWYRAPSRGRSNSLIRTPAK